MQNKFFIGLDIGGTKLAAAVVTPGGKILGRAKTPTPLRATPKEIITAIRDLFKDVLDEADISKKDLAGIGIGVPGLINAEGNRILRTPNIHLAKFPLVPSLKEFFPTTIVLGNDVNVGLLGEKWLGAGRKSQNIVGIFVGTGVGGAVIIDEKLFTGSQGLAAEIGHMTMDLKGPACHCGNKGCLEAFIGRWAIERDIREAIAHGEKTVLKELFEGKTSVIKSKSLKKALAKKDRVVTKVMQNAGQTLGAACVSLKHLFNPDLIILGGGVFEACGDFLLPIVKKTIAADPFFYRMDHCPVVTAHLADDAGVLGAAALIKERVGAPLKHVRTKRPSQKPR